MTKRRVYVSRCYRHLRSAGNKAKTDNEHIMHEMGFVSIGLPQKINPRKGIGFFYNLASVLRACCVMKEGDELVLQYPVKKYFTLLCKVAHARGAKVIVVIHDLGSMRRKKLSPAKEISRLSNADCIIAHNENMKAWLLEHNVCAKVVALGLFDFLSPAKPSLPHKTERLRVAYAGTLLPRNSGFLFQLKPYIKGYEMHLYGAPDPEMDYDESLVFHGFTLPGDFIANVQADFGLIWEGESLDGCTGDFGSYLRYNTPHKVSFYLRAGIPVIVWKEAAVAPIIQKAGVGIAVKSLKELPERLAQISSDEMQAMRNRALAISEQLNSGHFFKTALAEAEKELG